MTTETVVPADSFTPGEAPRDRLFRLLVEQVKDYAIFGLDPTGHVATWNAGAERIKGYKAEEIIGHHFSRFYPEEAIRSGWPKTELERATAEGRFEDEGWRIRKDGSRFWANVVITALRGEDGKLIGFAKVTRDLTERRRLERLEADAEQMGEFVAMLGHELRNPLAPIVSAATIAQQQVHDIERVTWALGVVQRQAAVLKRLVDDLLDVSRVTRGHVRLERKRLALRDVVELAVESARPGCDAKGHALRTELQGYPWVRGDATRLSQVLSNLIGNACKYTPEGGTIVVRLTTSETRAVLSVEDTGMGIAPDLLPRVFDIFTQDRRSLARSEGGLGLGLTITKRLVEMHGGEISVESGGSGCGSTFTIRLPIIAAQAGPDAPPPSLIALVADDNRDNAESMQALLELAGHKALVAFDGRSAVNLAKEHLPDLILLDLGMPGMDGFEAARAIRSSPELEGVRMIAVTGYGAEEDRRRAMEAGFDAHFAKPLTLDALEDAVEGM